MTSLLVAESTGQRNCAPMHLLMIVANLVQENRIILPSSERVSHLYKLVICLQASKTHFINVQMLTDILQSISTLGNCIPPVQGQFQHDMICFVLGSVSTSGSRSTVIITQFSTEETLSNELKLFTY